MGYQTDFIGYLQIKPPLGERERSVINRISGSLFLLESDGGLRVADEDDELLRELLRNAPHGWSTVELRRSVSRRHDASPLEFLAGEIEARLALAKRTGGGPGSIPGAG